MISKKTIIQQFKFLVRLLTEIILKTSLGRVNTDDRIIVDVGFVVPEPIILYVDLSAIITRKCILCG